MSEIAELYQQMARIRAFETAVQQLWQTGQISGEMHQSSGEEAVTVGVLAHLREDDALSLAHRTSAGMVARGLDLKSLLHEMLGHEQGLCHGRGGHMHLFSKTHLAASSGIVGASLPIGAGLALSAKRLRPGSLAVAFTGEGALNQGMALETLNLSKAWNLPLLVVCIDNGWAITTESADVTAGEILERVKAFDWDVLEVDGSDVGTVFKAASTLVARCRKQRGPCLLYAKCPRLDGHFLGDPLLQQANQPSSEQTLKTVARVVSSALSSGGGGVASRAGSLLNVVGTMGKARREAARGDSRDPIVITRSKLSAQGIDPLPLEAAAEQEVQEALSAVLTKDESCES